MMKTLIVCIQLHIQFDRLLVMTYNIVSSGFVVHRLHTQIFVLCICHRMWRRKLTGPLRRWLLMSSGLYTTVLSTTAVCYSSVSFVMLFLSIVCYVIPLYSLLCYSSVIIVMFVTLFLSIVCYVIPLYSLLCYSSVSFVTLFLCHYCYVCYVIPLHSLLCYSSVFIFMLFLCHYCYCLSNAMYSIGQNIKLL